VFWKSRASFYHSLAYVYIPVDTLYKHNGMAILALFLFVSILYQRVTNRRTFAVIRAIGLAYIIAMPALSVAMLYRW